VKEEFVRAETIVMLQADLGQLLSYSRTGEIPRPVRDAITRAIQLRQAVIDTERRITEHTQQIAGIADEQNRIRENMKTVSQNAQYYERLLQKLNEQESLIERLQSEREVMIQSRNAERAALEAYLADLVVG
jgi:DNA repair exonuclease SbcCD ATPase subunit